MNKALESGEVRASSGGRFFLCLSLGLGAAALVSSLLTFLEMKSGQAAPGKEPGAVPVGPGNPEL